MTENFEVQYDITKKSKFKKFYESNKVLIYSFTSIIVILFIIFNLYLDNKEKKKISLSENYVEAKIYLVDSNIININADFAKYNSKNYETNFSQNVQIKYLNHKISCNNLELYIEKNIALLTNNIIYKNFNTTIQGDRLEIDLITKDSIMSMNDKSKKIIILNKSNNGNN